MDVPTIEKLDRLVEAELRKGKQCDRSKLIRQLIARRAEK